MKIKIITDNEILFEEKILINVDRDDPTLVKFRNFGDREVVSHTFEFVKGKKVNELVDFENIQANLIEVFTIKVI